MRSKLAELVFWFHVFLIGCVLSLGLWFSVWIVVAIMVMHRIQFLALRGCVLSQLQERLEPLPSGMSFLQYAWFRFTGMKITARQEQVLDAVLVCTPILIAMFK